MADAVPAAMVNNPEAGHQTGVFPPFDTHNFVPQLVWLVIIFGALYWLMSRIALPRVEGILSARASRISSDLDQAHRMGEQAQAASLAYDKTLADAKSRAQVLAQKTHDELHAQSEAKRQALESELNGKLEAAERQIVATKVSAMSNVDQIARDAAATIVEHLTGKSASPELLAAGAAASTTH